MRSLLRNEDGATAIEYGLLASVIAVAAASAIVSLGNGVSDHYDTIDEEYSNAQN